MSGPYTITRYTRADRGELLEFSERVYPPGEFAMRLTQWDWKYDKNPLNPTDEPLLVLLRHQNTLIGMLGAIPLRIAVQGTEYPIVHACDLMIDPAYRGEHLSERLISEYMRLNPVGYGWLNERSHRRTSALKRTGWAHVMPLVKPFDPIALVSHMAAKTPGRRNSPPLSPFTAATRNGITISQIFNFDARFDDLWNRIRVQFPVIGTRDSRFLNWRYAQRPDLEYLILTASKGADLLGYLIVRLAEKNGMRFGYLVDIAVADPSTTAAAHLIHAGCAWLKTNKASAAKFVVTNPGWRRKFFAHGFLPQFWGTQPYFHSRSDRSEPLWHAYRDVNQWFLTMGDGDFEISL